MDKLNIETLEGKNSFAPGEMVQGTVQWNLGLDNPEAIELSLFWQTTGKGTRDVGVVETVKFDNPGSLGRKDFSFKLPTGPYSFSGKLISILWALEAVAWPGERTARRDITVSPTGEEIVLK